jgi:2-oxoglutarate dehydrogenase E1 component
MVPSFHNLEMLNFLYEQYLANPEQLDPSWKYFFDGWQMAKSLESPTVVTDTGAGIGVYRLVEAYRVYGHLLASFNPLYPTKSQIPPQLDFKTYGLKENDAVPSFGFFRDELVPLKQLIEALKKVYCSKVGFEYIEGEHPEIEKWIQDQIEPTLKIAITKEQRKKLLHDLNRAELFETFIHTKYVGQKRFSLEGLETLIPFLSFLLEEAQKLGVVEAGIGMAHRGRLNVLANIFKKSYAHIFHEFEDHYEPLTEGAGDVKYHKGFESNLEGMRLLLAANPSHLESVDPVVEGGLKAIQITQGKKVSEILPILIHGDAAVAGQGVVYETMQFQKLRGYDTGGTIHIIANNQIGFTTTPDEYRSTRYSTDIAKAFASPVFHINAEDPESCIAVALLAIRLRQKFGCDVLIDLNGYRKYGHNEGDEPAFTQPLEYKVIRSKKTIREIYIDQLLADNHLTQEEVVKMEEEFKGDLSKAMIEAKAPSVELHPSKPKPTYNDEVKTGVSVANLKRLVKELSVVPPGFEVHPKIQRILQDRVESSTYDWATAETLSYATLLEEGIHVRISGQDSQRGTFSHRHGVLIDQHKEGKYFPLSHLKGAKALFDVYNSSLSEAAVLGFEFGYSLEARNALIIWEAQYGDFANAAQVYIDQYLAASEQKWGVSSSLTLLLPHGYEGAGAEHSSARIERFLQLSGEANMRVANVSTPAQLFHLLRRQGLDKAKKPLILFTPKALLRHPLVVSKPEDFEKGEFQTILDDPSSPTQAKILIFCSGKIYYDLFLEREKRKLEKEYAFVRVEMLYPFDENRAKELLAKYQASKVLWVQEEHANMGAYSFLRPKLEKLLGNRTLAYVGRAESASTAAGSYKLHKKQFQSILEQVFS